MVAGFCVCVCVCVCVWVCVWVFYKCFYYAEEIPLYSQFSDCSYHERLFEFFLKILFIYSWEREAETQAEGEAGSMQGAWRGTRSQDPKITPWAEGRYLTAEPPRLQLTLNWIISYMDFSLPSFSPFFPCFLCLFACLFKESRLFSWIFSWILLIVFLYYSSTFFCLLYFL